MHAYMQKCMHQINACMHLIPRHPIYRLTDLSTTKVHTPNDRIAD